MTPVTAGHSLDIVVLGLSITSSWGNGHATTYRGLLRALSARGHRVLFLERDVPWYAENRDLPRPGYARTELYQSLEELRGRFGGQVRRADLVMVGSFVPDGRAVTDWVQATAQGCTAFYDIDTPATLTALERGDCAYLTAQQIPGFDLYLSFTGGPILRKLERQLGAPRARALYCSFDPQAYFPEARERRWDLGYMGTYSADRQPVLERLLLQPARALPGQRFVVAGPQYPADLRWPANVQREQHVAPADHRRFYCQQRFTLNVTRADMVSAGHAPSVRLFEAAACGVPIISDPWPGLETFFLPGKEILVARSAEETRGILETVSDSDRQRLATAARRRVLHGHTAEHRARALEGYLEEVRQRSQPEAASG
jgi:spore maturation protein CgeB